MRLPAIYIHSQSSTGIVTFGVELEHRGLKKHRVIKDRDGHMLERRATLQLEQWEEQWAKKQAREAAKREKEQALQEAQNQTNAAQQRLATIENILHYTLTRDDSVDWDTLKDFAAFPDAKPKASLPPKPKLHSQPDEPNADAERFKPTFSFFDNFSSRRKDARRQEARERYDADLREWQRKCERVTRANKQRKQEYKAALARAKADYQTALDKWHDARKDYIAKQRARNKKVDEHRTRWQACETKAVEAYCDIVLSGSSYDECCPQEFKLEYNRENRMLVVDYQLPPPDALPTIAEVKYVISRKELVEKNLPITRQRKMYDSVLYQITLRTLHEFVRSRFG